MLYFFNLIFRQPIHLVYITIMIFLFLLLVKLKILNFHQLNEIDALRNNINKITSERQNIANELEVEHVRSTKRINDLFNHNNTLVLSLNKLRKNNINTGIAKNLQQHSSASSILEHCSATNGLSDTDAEFLFRIAKEADEASEYAHTCYEWIQRNIKLSHKKM